MAQEEYEVSVRTIEHPGFDPRTALARLRTFTPGRAHFLLESLAPDTDAGRYSIVGYRVRSGASLPPAVDVEKELRELASGPRQDTFAQALALATVGFIDDQAMTLDKGVRLHEDMVTTGVFSTRSAVMLYDHHDNKVHVAGRVIGKAAERLIWELEHAPEIPEITVVPGAMPKNVTPRAGEKKFKARGGRVQSFVGEEIEMAILREELASFIGDADGLAVYRALVALDGQRQDPHTHGFFIDFGSNSPIGEHSRVLGLSSTPIHQQRRGEEGEAWPAFTKAVPSEAFYGRPPVAAARVLREIEDGGRQLWGDAVGYTCPGGESAWMLVEKGAFLSGNTFICHTGVAVDGDTDCAELADLAMEGAQDQLAALAAAQAHAVAHPPAKPADPAKPPSPSPA